MYHLLTIQRVTLYYYHHGNLNPNLTRATAGLYEETSFSKEKVSVGLAHKLYLIQDNVNYILEGTWTWSHISLFTCLSPSVSLSLSHTNIFPCLCHTPTTRISPLTLNLRITPHPAYRDPQNVLSKKSSLSRSIVQIGPHKDRNSRARKHAQIHMIPEKSQSGRAGRHNYE